MESGVSYDKQRLHKMGYFTELLSTNEEIRDSVRPLLRLGREYILLGQRLDRALISSLEPDPLLSERLRRLRTIPGVGPITALTWALEIGDYTRFQSGHSGGSQKAGGLHARGGPQETGLRAARRVGAKVVA